MRRLVAALLVLTALTGAVGCGSSTGSNAAAGSEQAQRATTTPPPDKVHFAKTKFILHAGLAFGAFHRYIYKPWRTGAFTHASRVKKGVILAKAGLAGLFAYHELKLAAKDARADPLLSKLIGPVDALAARLQTIGTSLRHGKVDPAAIQSADGAIGSLSRQSAKDGAPLKDVAPPPSLRPVP